MSVLNHASGTSFKDGRDGKTAAATHPNVAKAAEGAAALAHSDPSIQASEGKDATAKPVADHEPSFRVPPTTAIAGVLIKDWVEGKIVSGNRQVDLKGNL